MHQVTELAYEDSDSAVLGGYTSLKGKGGGGGGVLSISRRAQNCVVHVKWTTGGKQRIQLGEKSTAEMAQCMAFGRLAGPRRGLRKRSEFCGSSKTGPDKNVLFPGKSERREKSKPSSSADK
jgi:hypothetical protein